MVCHHALIVLIILFNNDVFSDGCLVIVVILISVFEYQYIK